MKSLTCDTAKIQADKQKIKRLLHNDQRLIAIGASTGGPGVIKQILTELGEHFDVPIVIAQHIQQGFLQGFVSWLNVDSHRTIKLAEEGEEPQSGYIYIANTSGNLSLDESYKFRYLASPVTQLYTPNIDYLFNKLSERPLDASAILLTGMGSDGAIGLKNLADKGWNTYVQSAATCVVNGMPNAALKLSARHQIASPSQLAQFLNTFGLANPTKRKAK